MGIHKGFNKENQKWYWKGFGFIKYYETETECNADKENVWKLHMEKLKAFRIVSNMLVAYR